MRNESAKNKEDKPDGSLNQNHVTFETGQAGAGGAAISKHSDSSSDEEHGKGSPSKSTQNSKNRRFHHFIHTFQLTKYSFKTSILQSFKLFTSLQVCLVSS